MTLPTGGAFTFCVNYSIAQKRKTIKNGKYQTRKWDSVERKRTVPTTLTTNKPRFQKENTIA